MTAFQDPPASGLWRAKFIHKGRQVWVKGSPWPTKKAAEAAERAERDRFEQVRSEETCASFTERWLEEWPRPAEGTRRTYKSAVDRFAAHFGDRLLVDVDRLTARTWALTVPRGISRVVSIMYEDARNVGLVQENPFSNLRLPAQEKTQGQVLAPTLDEFRALLAACPVLEGWAPEFRALIQLAAWTGLRSGELQALAWGDVDGDLLHVRHSRQRSGSLGSPKNGHERTIALLSPAKVLDQVPRRPDDPFVFHAPRGGTLKNGSLFYGWRAVRAASGIASERERRGQRNIRFHDLRHFYAYRLKDWGVDPYTISMQLGHRDGGTLVIERYGMGGEERANAQLLERFAQLPIPETDDAQEIGSSPTQRARKAASE